MDIKELVMKQRSFYLTQQTKDVHYRIKTIKAITKYKNLC